MQRNNCIYLLGYMGSGKSYVGKRLAAHLKQLFIDLDQRIIQQEGCTIPELFQNHGEAYFRAVETQMLRATFRASPAVVALGGGAPIYHDNMAWLLAHGTTVFLDPPLDTLFRRVQNDGTTVRPLLAQERGDSLRQHMATMLAQRRPIYAQAQYHIKEAEQQVEAVLAALGNAAQ